jgi:hypothetical protein
MRLTRVLALLVLVLSAIVSFTLAAGCGGDLSTGSVDGGACTTQGTVQIDQNCTTDCDCAVAGMICTKAPYDRKPSPVCTYQCDANNMNPACPMGCNLKGYCKLN